DMSLTEKDKVAIKELWKKISKSSDTIGVEAVSRLLNVYPQTKTYFTHWPDNKPGSTYLKAHAKKVMGGIALAVVNIDDLTGGLMELSEKHAFTLRVDPANFKLLNHCILVVISMLFPNEFSPEYHVAFDKFLAGVAVALSEKYR
uniref:Globin domain-containing protein n=1 Tax=Mola mola TaxID=94237 RepID=A0A3Q3VYM8_MOLML